MQKPNFNVGDRVLVERRKFPGFNHDGGAGKITKVNFEEEPGKKYPPLKDGSEGGLRTTPYTYNIKYVLGYSEKRVDASWIILSNPEDVTRSDLRKQRAEHDIELKRKQREEDEKREQIEVEKKLRRLAARDEALKKVKQLRALKKCKKRKLGEKSTKPKRKESRVASKGKRNNFAVEGNRRVVAKAPEVEKQGESVSEDEFSVEYEDDEDIYGLTLGGVRNTAVQFKAKGIASAETVRQVLAFIAKILSERTLIDAEEDEIPIETLKKHICIEKKVENAGQIIPDDHLEDALWKLHDKNRVFYNEGVVWII
eukprot:snap_masked-scaffold_5-processed-gene-17.39-mRNA-1 protein AED:1.00 eAED:1.00 QI:0/-1/0/0/-1/1/1/0/311